MMVTVMMMVWPVPCTGNTAQSPLELVWDAAESVDVGPDLMLEPGQGPGCCGAAWRGGVAMGGPGVGVTWGRGRQVWMGRGIAGGGALVMGVCGAGDGLSVRPLIRKPDIIDDLGDWPGPLILGTAYSIGHQPLIQEALGWSINIVTQSSLCSLQVSLWINLHQAPVFVLRKVFKEENFLAVFTRWQD